MIRIAISAVHRLMMLGNRAENRVTALARAGGYDGVICGHFHKPALRSSGGVTYANCGDWAISLRANAPHLWRLIGLDYISGERVMPLSLLQADLQALRDLPRFGIEVHLNRRWISAGQRIAVVPWPGVHSPSKSRKRGFFAGLLADLAMQRDISRTVSLREAAAQIIAMRRLGI